MKTKKQYLLKGAIDGFLIAEILLCIMAFFCWTKESMPYYINENGFEGVVSLLWYYVLFQCVWGWFVFPPIVLASFLFALGKWKAAEVSDGS
ncbi:MAG: hypothetical protein IPG59_21190 [Candidatus Melainabacteria bacterium]|nr:MAG: hypothetical protein IPG59_21190 [Candidatus Melainabacteria bacterium]